MTKKLGRYKGSQREKQDRLDFQKEILKCLQLAKRAMARFPNNEQIKTSVESMSLEYLAEKKRIENDY